MPFILFHSSHSQNSPLSLHFFILGLVDKWHQSAHNHFVPLFRWRFFSVSLKTCSMSIVSIALWSFHFIVRLWICPTLSATGLVRSMLNGGVEPTHTPDPVFHLSLSDVCAQENTCLRLYCSVREQDAFSACLIILTEKCQFSMDSDSEVNSSIGGGGGGGVLGFLSIINRNNTHSLPARTTSALSCYLSCWSHHLLRLSPP